MMTETTPLSEREPLSPTSFLKVLNTDRTPYHGGHGRWTMMKRRSVRGPLVACRNGIHVVTEAQLFEWFGPAIHPVIAVSDERIDAGDKTVCRWVTIGVALATWNEQTSRQFACDCAERALLRERMRGREPDSRSWESIATARRFAVGEATREELAAAWDAARAAARAAARDAAWDAAWAAARDAAWAAARDAAKDAARDAAKDAARDAERSWQIARLGLYLRGEPLPPLTLEEGLVTA